MSIPKQYPQTPPTGAIIYKSTTIERDVRLTPIRSDESDSKPGEWIVTIENQHYEITHHECGGKVRRLPLSIYINTGDNDLKDRCTLCRKEPPQEIVKKVKFLSRMTYLNGPPGIGGVDGA